MPQPAWTRSARLAKARRKRTTKPTGAPSAPPGAVGDAWGCGFCCAFASPWPAARCKSTCCFGSRPSGNFTRQKFKLRFCICCGVLETFEKFAFVCKFPQNLCVAFKQRSESPQFSAKLARKNTEKTTQTTRAQSFHLGTERPTTPARATDFRHATA